MPCTVDMSAEYQREAEKLTKMLCALCKLFESWNVEDAIPEVPGLPEWWERHKKLDQGAWGDEQ